MKFLNIFTILLISFVFTQFNTAQDFWEPTNGPSQNEINFILENSNGNIFAATEYTGLFKTTNNGNTWQSVNNGFTTPHILALNVNQDGHLFAGTFGSGCIYRSTNGGSTWVEINDGLESHWNTYSILTKENEEVIIGTSYGVFRSTNNGDDWYSLTSGSGLDYTYNSIAINDSGFIYAGGNGIIRSFDDGNNWNQILPGKAVKMILINDLGYIFVGTIASGGLWRSTDDGLNWERKNNGFPNSDINITSLVSNRDGYIFAGTEINGVFVSTDNGEEWVQINEGLTNYMILSLMVKQDGYIFAGTNGSGVFRSTSSTTGVDESNQFIYSFKLFQNYPNPFNPSTIIKFSIPSVETYRDASLLITLKVFDILGKEVATLVNEEKPAGNYEVEFNASHLASGIYYYQLKAGDYVELKKMILMK